MRAAHLGTRPFKRGFAVPAGGGGGGGTGGTGGGTGSSISGRNDALFATTVSGWTGSRIFYDDFDTNVAEGAATNPDQPFLSNPSYSAKWSAYNEYGYVTNQNPAGGGNGNHYGGGLSVSNSELIMRQFRGSDGKWWATAPIPEIGTYGQLYGRYAVCWRIITPNSLVKTAWELWPTDNNWPTNGEIDLPEGTVTSNIGGFMHHQAGTGPGDQEALSLSPSIAYGTNVWHTTICEWKPNSCKMIVDNQSVTFTTRVPSTKMFWVMQTEPNLGGAQPSGEMKLGIDVVSIHSYTGP